MASDRDNLYKRLSLDELREAYWKHVDESKSLAREGKESGEEHGKIGTQILDAISERGSIIEFIRAGKRDLAKKVDETPQEENKIIRELSHLERFFKKARDVVHTRGVAGIESSSDTRYDGGSGYTVTKTFKLKVAGKITDWVSDLSHYDNKKELQELPGDIRDIVMKGVEPYPVEQCGENFIIHGKNETNTPT